MFPGRGFIQLILMFDMYFAILMTLYLFNCNQLSFIKLNDVMFPRICLW